MTIAEKIRQKHAELVAQARSKEKSVGPKTVREALAADGVSVKVSYVKLVLWRDRKRKQQGPVRRQRRRPDPSGVNRSEEIRKLLKTQSDLTNAEIQAALAKDGIEVSMSLVKVVKHNLQKKKPATSKKKSKLKRRRPAPPDTNLSKEIRKLLKVDPNRRTASIQEELAERGIDVSASLVKVVRHNLKKKLSAEKRPAEFVGDDEVPDLPPARMASQQKKERQERREESDQERERKRREAEAIEWGLQLADQLEKPTEQPYTE